MQGPHSTRYASSKGCPARPGRRAALHEGTEVRGAKGHPSPIRDRNHPRRKVLPGQPRLWRGLDGVCRRPGAAINSFVIVTNPSRTSPSPARWHVADDRFPVKLIGRMVEATGCSSEAAKATGCASRADMRGEGASPDDRPYLRAGGCPASLAMPWAGPPDHVAPQSVFCGKLDDRGMERRRYSATAWHSRTSEGGSRAKRSRRHRPVRADAALPVPPGSRGRFLGTARPRPLAIAFLRPPRRALGALKPASTVFGRSEVQRIT